MLKLRPGSSDDLAIGARNRCICTVSNTPRHTSSAPTHHSGCAPCAGWTSPRSARRLMGARGSTFLAGAVFDLRGAIEGAAVVSAEPSPATPQPPAFRTGPYPADAHLLIYALSCRSGSDHFSTRLSRRRCSSPPLCLADAGAARRVAVRPFLCASCMWPGALGAKNGRVRMAMWSSEVARGRQEALDSLKLTLN